MEVTWRIASKPKAQNPEQHFYDNNVFFENFKRQIIRLAQGHWLCTQLTKTVLFIATPMKKTYLAVHFTKVCFCQFLDRKVMGLVPKY